MMSREEMIELARRRTAAGEKGQPCPYGRGCTVGSEGCMNCVFNKVEVVTGTPGGGHCVTSRCSGDERSVAEHEERLRRWGLAE